MGDNNRVRQGAAWTSYGKVYVRSGATWPQVNRAWVREGFDWKQYYTLDPPAQVTCMDQNVCQAGGSPGCATLSGCTNNGEIHRIEWSFIGSASGFHAAVHRSVNGGAYTEALDNQDLDGGNFDVGCCEFTGDCDTYDGSAYMQEHVSTLAGSCTTTYQYRVRAEHDGTDTISGSAQTHGSSQTGCDSACIA